MHSLTQISIGDSDHGYISDRGMHEQGLFYLPRADVDPAGNDEVSSPAGQVEVTVVVKVAQIPDRCPTPLVHDRRGFLAFL